MLLPPSQFRTIKAIEELLRSNLASLGQTLQNIASAIRDKEISQDEPWKKEMPRSIASLRPKPEEQAAGEANQERRHKQNLRIQRALTLGTWLAFGAAFIYAWFAHDQLREARTEAETMSRQVADFEGSERAVLQIYSVIDPSKNEYTLIVENIGLSPALHINVQGRPISDVQDLGGGNPISSAVKDNVISIPPDPDGFPLAAGKVKCYTYQVPSNTDLTSYYQAKHLAYLQIFNIGYEDAFGHTWSDAHTCFFWHTTMKHFQSCLGPHQYLDTPDQQQQKSKCQPSPHN
jgi:hypothetical protein